MPQDAAQEGREALIQRAALAEMLRGKTPGERIAFLRREKKWSQNQLASAIRGAGATCSGKWKICRWETNENVPREPTRLALAFVLGVDVRTLFDT